MQAGQFSRISWGRGASPCFFWTRQIFVALLPSLGFKFSSTVSNSPWISPLPFDQSLILPLASTKSEPVLSRTFSAVGSTGNTQNLCVEMGQECHLSRRRSKKSKVRHIDSIIHQSQTLPCLNKNTRDRECSTPASAHVHQRVQGHPWQEVCTMQSLPGAIAPFNKCYEACKLSFLSKSQSKRHTFLIVTFFMPMEHTDVNNMPIT